MPNAITLARLLLVVPGIVWLVLATDWRLATAILLVVFGATDWVDGFVARRTGSISAVGIWLDPLADRFGIVLVIAALTLAGLLPWPLTVLVVAVDAVVFSVGMWHRSRMDQMQASLAGKLRTTLIMVALPAVLLGEAAVPAAGPLAVIGLVCFAAGAVLHAVAGAGYVHRLTRGGRRTVRTPLL